MLKIIKSLYLGFFALALMIIPAGFAVYLLLVDNIVGSIIVLLTLPLVMSLSVVLINKIEEL